MAQIKHKDARAKSLSRTQLGVQNQSLVWSVFEDGEKLTVGDVYEKVRARLAEQEQKPLHERTIRRALDSLERSGFIKTVGRQNNAILYGKQSSSFAGSPLGESLVPIGNELETVENFLRTFADPELNAFKVKIQTLSEKADLNLRRRFLFAVISAGEPGYDDQLKKASEALQVYLNEIEHVRILLKNFIDSAVWHSHYRDRIAHEVRKVQEKDPELFQLTMDVIKGG